MTNHLTVIRDIPLAVETKVIGRYWTPEEAAEQSAHTPTFLSDDDFEDCDTFVDQIEDKVVKPRGRRPRRPTEGVETK